MKSLHQIAHWLVIIGGLNWGLIAVGYFIGSNLNVVNLILGSNRILEMLVYLLVGLSAIHLLTTHKKHCNACNA